MSAYGHTLGGCLDEVASILPDKGIDTATQKGVRLT